jgi:hypothetical protein
VKVKVTGPYQVVHDDKRYVEGDEFDAPDGDAQRWVTAGYVEQVRERKSEKAQSGDDTDNKAQRSASNKATRSADSK